jgi:mRNA interferase MazF
MKKDYKEWMPKKAEINNDAARPRRYRKREIWLASVGENIGHEVDGKGEKFMRPVLVLQSYNKSTCHVVPLSTTKRRGKFWHEFDGHTGKKSVALLSQSKIVDTSRFVKKIGWTDQKTFDAIRARIRSIISL